MSVFLYTVITGHTQSLLQSRNPACSYLEFIQIQITSLSLQDNLQSTGLDEAQQTESSAKHYSFVLQVEAFSQYLHCVKLTGFNRGCNCTIKELNFSDTMSTVDT